MPASSDLDDEELGAWTEEDLAQIQSLTSPGNDVEVDSATRFCRGVMTLVRRRMHRAGAESDAKQLAVFILAAPSTELERIPMLDQGAVPLTGNAWFVNAAVVSGHRHPLKQGMTDDEVFRHIEQIGGAKVPVVVVDPRGSPVQVRYYARGIAEIDHVKVLSLSSTVTMAGICAAITKMHEQALVTPTVQTSPLWEDAGQWWPKQNAELLIQALVKTALLGAFMTCNVHEEVKGADGRVDLHIEEPHPVDPTTKTDWAVLELKVLRSFGSTGDSHSQAATDAWIDSGIVQAMSYKVTRKYRMAGVCCFDMRKTDVGNTACFSAHQQKAADNQVELHRWYLYASAVQYRAAITAKKA